MLIKNLERLRITTKRVQLFTVVLALSLILPQIPTVKIASVDDGGYPWTNATELNTATYDWGYATCPSDAPGCMTKPYIKNGVTYGEYDARNFYFRNCTSYVAWKIKQVLGANLPGTWGDGANWDTNATTSGYTVYTGTAHTPEVGEIAQWDSPGHVAYVTAVDSNGIASLAEYNIPGGSGNFKSTRTTASDSAGTPNHYIRIGNVAQSRPTSTNTLPWGFETLDGDLPSVSGYDSETGKTAISVTFNGQLHIFSYDQESGDLRFAKTTPSWQFSTLDGHTSASGRQDGDVGQGPTATVYNGTIQLFYYAGSGGNLRHAWTSDGSSWSFENLDGVGGGSGRTNSDVGQSPTVAIYGTSLQLYYRDAGGTNLRHAWTSPSSGWSFETLDGDPGSTSGYTGDVGNDPVAVTQGDILHILSYDGGAGNLRRAWADAGGWHFQNIDGDPGSVCGGQYVDAGINPTAAIYGNSFQVLYYDASAKNLRHAWLDSTWHCETLEGDTGAILGHAYDDVGSMPALASIGGNLQAFAKETKWGSLRHYWYDTNGWHVEDFDGLGGNPAGRISHSVGDDPHINIFGSTIQVFYYDQGHGNLRHSWVQ